jgi:hypothetical protein
VRRAVGSGLISLGVLGLVVWLAMRKADDVSRALDAVPSWTFLAVVALHAGTLLLRSEAWRLTLAAVEGRPLPRRSVHAANAAAFLAGTAQSQAALPARVALLRRLAGSAAPPPAQIAMADVPIFALELCATSTLLFASALAGLSDWWVAPATLALALAVLAAARMAPERYSQRPMLRGLAVLDDRRRRRVLVALVMALSALSVVRIWLVLSVCGLPHGLGEIAWLWAALGIFGLLPLGPGAPAGATLATLGGDSLGAAVAGGLMLGASSIAGVLVYGLGVAVLWLAGRPVRAPRARPLRDLR